MNAETYKHDLAEVAPGGRIRVDGVDVRRWAPDALRKQVGTVLQQTTLFSGTVRDNIAYGRPDASLDEVVAAAQAAQAHDFIMSFSDGYQTEVGERGVDRRKDDLEEPGGQDQRDQIEHAAEK